jgi:hypothetical protein
VISRGARGGAADRLTVQALTIFGLLSLDGNKTAFAASLRPLRETKQLRALIHFASLRETKPRSPRCARCEKQTQLCGFLSFPPFA